MSEPIAVVVGASGGIGRALCGLLIDQGRYECVVALSRRRPEGWAEGPGRMWLPVDVLDETSVARAAETIKDLGPLGLIVAATGRLHGPGLSPERTYRALNPARMIEVFAINAVAPALIAKHFLPLTPIDGPSVFAALSARVGSIGDNRIGGWHAYRASKAALNMLVRNLAIEHARTRPQGVCVSLHPGTVATALSAPFQAGVAREKLFTPAFAAGSLMGVIDRLEPKDTGGFFAWDGTMIAW